MVGYKKEIKWSANRHPGGWGGISKSDFDKTKKYIFRVRSKTDSNGNVIEARYGKIDSDIEFFNNRKVNIRLSTFCCG